MAGNLRVSSVKAPAFMGLNTQESEVTLAEGYATRAYNCVIDRYGRLGARRGWQMYTQDNGTLAADEFITSIFEFKDGDGTITYLTASNSKLFTGIEPLVEKKVRNEADDADETYAITSGNWQVCALQVGTGTAVAEAYLAQNGHPTLIYSKAATNNAVYRLLGDVGSVPTGYTTSTFDPNCVTSAYGRVWYAGMSNNKLVVHYSQLLVGNELTGTGAGLLDVSSQVGDNDEIVAINSYNGNLIIFCKNNILVYDNADDPTQLSLLDTIRGVGCIARDSVRKCGEDLVFLSKSGLRSLRRTVQEKSMPMRELSINIRDDLIDAIINQQAGNIKSVYFERDAFYLLSFPSQKQVVCFDMRVQLENGAARTTYWEGLDFAAYCAAENNNLYLGVRGGVARYFGYNDNGNTYRMVWFSTSSDVGQSSILKILKKAKLTVISDSEQDYVFKWGFTYADTFSSRTIQKTSKQIVSEYNIAEYDIGEYSGAAFISQSTVNIGGQGDIVKIGFETEVNGSPVSLQRIDLYYKTGRLV
jgi:hypothetical protein